jgi:Rit1 N-terminal domain
MIKVGVSYLFPFHCLSHRHFVPFGEAVSRTLYLYLVTSYLASSETHCCDDPLRSLAGWSQDAEIALLRTESSSLCARQRSIEWYAPRVLGLWESIAHYPPLLGNIRAGAWYVPPFAQRSFYTSADGHYAHWNVTPRRPNITLLYEAVPDGGAVGVDVTRAGKIGLDALSKTLPTWGAILSAVAAGLDANSGDSEQLQALLHLHPSVRRRRIGLLAAYSLVLCKRRETPVFDMLALVPELSGAGGGDACVLRPLWVRADAKSQWEDGRPMAERLGYVPIECISASPPLQTGSRHLLRRRLLLATAARNVSVWRALRSSGAMSALRMFKVPMMTRTLGAKDCALCVLEQSPSCVSV